ncbi:MAG: non-homologous end-joining DNA ligase [Acidimicrobiia bacterium]
MSMIRFGISRLPTGHDDAAFLDDLVDRGHQAVELPFVKDFPWNEKRCLSFGRLAAERDIAVSVHAPYFAILTVEEEERAKQCLAALEHTMKLGKALGSRIICAHLGNKHGRSGPELLDLVRGRLDYLGPKVQHLGVALGLETAGKESAFGTLGDIALLASEFPFVRPLVDWAHVHAISGGALTSKEAFASVIGFLRDNFPGWMIDPLQAQFTDNLFGDKGEIKHIPYGTGSMKIGPLVEAARDAGLRMVVISEAKEQKSHDAMLAEIQATLAGESSEQPEGVPLASGAIEFPEPIRVVHDGSHARPVGLLRPLRLSNIEKPFFPDGYTKGDLIQYYASIAPVLVPHLQDRAIVMARFPDGADGDFFYEKQAPGHQPDWMPLAPIHSGHRGTAIDFVTARDAESLMWLANMGCIEIHPWLSRVTSIDRPDFAIFDLDPAEGATWEQVVEVATLIKIALDQMGLIGYPKTSGATGLHIYVPLDPIYDYSRVRRFVEALGRLLVAANPDAITMEWDIPKRTGKVFIDHNQNVGGKTIASVYSVRPRSGAPVSAPFLWSELETVRPEDFTIVTIWDRLQRSGDLFAPVLAGGQHLEAAEGALGLT